MIQTPQNERKAALDQIMAAFRAQPVTWPRLLQIARSIAPALAALTSPAIELPADFCKTVIALAPESPAAQSTAALRALRRAMILLVEICAFGPREALARCTDEAATLADAAQIFTVLGQFLDTAGIARQLAPADLQVIASHRLPVARDRPDVLVASLALLGMASSAMAEDRRSVFEAVAIPQMAAAAKAGDVDTLLAVEGAAYNGYIKVTETPEHHAQAFGAIEKAYANLRPAPVRALSATQGSNPPRIVFLIPNGNLLAHTEVLLSFLSGLKALDVPAIDPFVLIYFSSDGGELGRRLSQLGVAWEALGMTRSFGYGDHLERVRQRISALSAEAAVFVSVPQYLAFYCRHPLAPVQIWWSMKFALPNFEGLNGRVFYRSLFDRKLEIAGRLWRGGPLAFAPPTRPDAAQVEAIRARFPGKILLGTVAREEKIANLEYLDAVAAILQQHPDAVFLWTGRAELRQISETFAGAGVDDRCHFIGWVNPTPYIAAFDLFLETYPLTGLMSGWAMALGKPIVSVGSLGFLANYLEPILDGTILSEPGQVERIREIFAPVAKRMPGLWAPHPRDMIAFANTLISDSKLRKDVGDAQQRYVEAFMVDERASAAIQSKHFAAIVSEARNSASG